MGEEQGFLVSQMSSGWDMNLDLAPMIDIR